MAVVFFLAGFFAAVFLAVFFAGVFFLAGFLAAVCERGDYRVATATEHARLLPSWEQPSSLAPPASKNDCVIGADDDSCGTFFFLILRFTGTLPRRV